MQAHEKRNWKGIMREYMYFNRLELARDHVAVWISEIKDSMGKWMGM